MRSESTANVAVWLEVGTMMSWLWHRYLIRWNFSIDFCVGFGGIFYNWKFKTFQQRFRHRSNIYLPSQHTTPTQTTGLEFWVTGPCGKVEFFFVLALAIFSVYWLFGFRMESKPRSCVRYVSMRCCRVPFRLFFPGIHQDCETCMKCRKMFADDDISSSYLWLYFNDMKI